jgi:hypothetical protein
MNWWIFESNVKQQLTNTHTHGFSASVGQFTTEVLK